jgi:hypothetical protein
MTTERLSIHAAPDLWPIRAVVWHTVGGRGDLACRLTRQ